MNSTETPGGSGIPAGWYDDPSGQGLRWWDGVQWTEHVHTVESAAAASGDADAAQGEREAPPPELVKLRDSIQARGAKGVGMVLGGLVLVIVVVALLLSGGSDHSGDAAQPGIAPPTAAQPILEKQIKALHQRLNSANLPKPLKKQLEKQLKALEKEAGVSAGSGKGSGGAKDGKSAKAAKGGAPAKSGGQSAKPKQKAPGEEGN